MDVALRVAETRVDDAQRPHLQGGRAGRDRERSGGAGALSGDAAMAERRRTASARSSRCTASTSSTAPSHALQGVDLTLDTRRACRSSAATAWARRTLCNAIMGLVPIAGGSIRFNGEQLAGRTPLGDRPARHRLCAAGAAAVAFAHRGRAPAAGGAGRRGAWTIDRVYSTFPRLAERRSNGGAQLSGGEQQMLAIGRALLTNPKLLVMDEPTEGLAPVIVSQVEDMLLRFGDEGEIDVLVIEQNIRRRDRGRRARRRSWSTAASTGSSNLARLAADRELQQRLLGVGRHGDGEREDDCCEPAGSSGGAAATPPDAPTKIYISNPAAPNSLDEACTGAPDRAGGAHHSPAWHRARAPWARNCGRSLLAGEQCGARGRHARHQGRRAALHSRPHPQGRTAACAWSTSRRLADIRAPTSLRIRSRPTIRAARAASSSATGAKPSPA